MSEMALPGFRTFVLWTVSFLPPSLVPFEKMSDSNHTIYFKRPSNTPLPNELHGPMHWLTVLSYSLTLDQVAFSKHRL